MKKIIILIAVVATSQLRAQQLEQWTQFFLNEYSINPAVSGLNKYYDANAMVRNQWVGIANAPRTYYLSVHGPMWQDKMGIGGAVYSDVTGDVIKSGLQASYAYHLKLNTDMKLSFALSMGVFQWAVNGAALNLENAYDQALSNGNMSVWKPDFGTSVRYTWKGLHAGINVPQVANLQAQLFNDYPSTENRMNRHYYLNVGYVHPINDDFEVEGNLLARYATLDMMDLMTRVTFKDMVWLGVLGRASAISQEFTAMGFMVGYKFENNLTIGYSYDLQFNQALKSATPGSHEVNVGIRFSKKNTKQAAPLE